MRFALQLRKRDCRITLRCGLLRRFPHACAVPLTAAKGPGESASFVSYQSSHGKPNHPRQTLLPVQELIMAKHVFRFPIVAMLLALLSASIPVLADNLDLASAQPEFGRVVT